MLKNPKKNCFAYCDGQCSVLHSNDCYKCKTFKTPEQCKKEQEETYKKIRAMPIEKQEYISKKYYRGKTPWNPEFSLDYITDTDRLDFDFSIDL